MSPPKTKLIGMFAAMRSETGKPGRTHVECLSPARQSHLVRTALVVADGAQISDHVICAKRLEHLLGARELLDEIAQPLPDVV
jgi:hypothetical protein